MPTTLCTCMPRALLLARVSLVATGCEETSEQLTHPFSRDLQATAVESDAAQRRLRKVNERFPFALPYAPQCAADSGWYANGTTLSNEALRGAVVAA